MGLCFSKKKKPPPKKVAAAVADDKAKKTAPQPKSAAKAAAVADKNAVKAKVAAEEKKKKRAPQEEAAAKQLPVSVVPSAPVRTSSCTKDEVDAILIQCGRLSRSSSGTGRTPSRETGGAEGGSHHRRRRSGSSKRSYDFDQERKAGDEEGDWESGRPVSRPSPHRGSPQRKRSGSRERSAGGTGSRRASRSPGRRGTEGGGVSSAAMGGGERARQQQPGKMVSVPAREKGRAPSPAAGIRCASPRSSSPARMVAPGNENACSGVPAAGPVLSRSSSRKAEQSPYRRNPMAELDENTLLRNTVTNNNAKPQKVQKFTDNTVPAAPTKATADRVKEPTGTASARSGNEKRETAEDATAAAASDTRALSAKMNGTRTSSAAAAERPRSRRTSRDFDQGSNNSYASQILEDIQNYHEQHQAATPSFSLPACVAKACSILDAVADLNSSSSSSSSGNNRTTHYGPTSSAADDKGSVNAALSAGTDTTTTRVAAARRHAHTPAAARDVIRTAEAAEPQESAGSNSVSAVPCTPSWEPASVESSDRTWSAASDEVVDQGCAPPSPVIYRPRQGKQRPEPSGSRSRAGSSAGNGNSSLHRGRSAQRGSGSLASGRSGVRTVSAAAS